MKTKAVGILLVFLLIAGCAGFDISLSTDTENYEAFGQTIGGYYKAKHPEDVAETLPWVRAALDLTNEEFTEADIIGVAYTFMMEKHPEDAELFALIKAGLDLLGLKITIDLENPEAVEKYIKTSKALLKGYLKGIS